jgi:SAM-dependent methyltransferase
MPHPPPVMKQLEPPTRGRIKRGGIHYTPAPLARFLAQRIGGRIDVGSRLRVLDPACGDGTLLDAAAHMLMTRRDQLELELLGFDTDARAVARAQQLLERWHSHGRVSVSRADFLSNPTGATAEAMPVDVVIANPPYVRTQVLGAKRSRDLAARFELAGRVDLYHACLKAIAAALRPGGVLGLLTSNRFLVTRAGQSMRDALVQDFDICEICDLGDTKLFEAAVLPAIVVARKSHTTTDRAEFARVYEVRVPDPVQSAEFSHVLEPLQSGFIGCFTVGTQTYQLQRGQLRNPVAGSVWTLSSPRTEEWLDRVRAHTECEVGDVARVRVGIKTTADSVFIRNDWTTLPGALQPEDQLLAPLLTHHVAEPWKITRPIQSTVLYPYDRRGRTRRPVDLRAFPRAHAYLESHRERLQNRRYLIESGRAWFEMWVAHVPSEWSLPKLVWPDISERPRFFLDTSEALVNGDCYWLRLRNGQNIETLYLIAGVANSTFATTYYDTLFHNKLYSGRRRFITQYVERFPLPPATSPTARRIIDLVETRVHDPGAKAVHEEIDALVWKAFGFSEVRAG